MIRIFLPPEQLTSEEIVITGYNARHLALALRVRPGESLVVFDGKGFKYECTILKVHKREVIAALNSKAPYSAESPVKIILAQGIAKGDKMDLIVQKSTELGVNIIIPLFTERAQIQQTHKAERWRKIALSASEQSGRDKVTVIEEPQSLTFFLSKNRSSKLQNSISIILSESHSEKNLKKILGGLNDINVITILIGPEGGFAQEEVNAAVEKGFKEVSLGPRILRTETAPLAVLSMIQYELGDMGQE